MDKPNISKIHKLGLSEIKRINQEIDELFSISSITRPKNEDLKKMVFKTKKMLLMITKE